MPRESDNAEAEWMLDILSRNHAVDAPRLISSFLDQRGIAHPGLRVWDGCGLSHRNRTTAATLAGLILYRRADLPGPEVHGDTAPRHTVGLPILMAVGTLAAGLAHEIRNPLNGALLHVTFLERALQRSSVGKEAHSALMIIGDEIRRLSALVKDFLVFARPSPPQIKATQLFELCERVAGVLSKDAATARVTIATDLGTSDHTFHVDPQKIEQALLNLLQNAVQAAGSNGGGNVTLRARRLPREIHIEIEDDGPGLPSPEAPIFDAFFTTKPQGTGLGLAIVQRIASDHGGTVEVDSRPGKTLFRLALPLRAPA